MKKFFLFVAVVSLFASCAPKGYTIEGTVNGEMVPSGKVILSNNSRVEPIADTVDLVAGKFSFKGLVTTPENYTIKIVNDDYTPSEVLEGNIRLFLDNSKITITTSLDEYPKASVVGGVTNDLITALQAQHDEVNARYGLQELLQEYNNKETSAERRQEIIEEYSKAGKENREIDSIFFANNPTSFYTIINLSQNVESMQLDEAQAKADKFNALPAFKDNRYLKTIYETIENLKRLEPGMDAPDFTMNDPEGNPVSLSDVYPNHKITMIDFWAGWCGPCRQFNPTLVGIYNDFKDHGFGILGVSLDREAGLWNQAIKDDNLTWIQVSDLNFWDTEAAKLYNVKFIPQNIFVDSEGKIVKRQVAKDEIVSFLKEYLEVE